MPSDTGIRPEHTCPARSRGQRAWVAHGGHTLYVKQIAAVS
jgi:hypothetical protein